MTQPQYRTREYRAAKEQLRPIVEAGLAYCAELVCVEPSRRIAPGAPWALAHDHRDPTGQTLLGPAHRRCNGAESARRNNPKRPRPAPRRLAL